MCLINATVFRFWKCRKFRPTHGVLVLYLVGLPITNMYVGLAYVTYV